MEPHQMRLNHDHGCEKRSVVALLLAYHQGFLKALLDDFKHPRSSMKISWLLKSMKNICQEKSIQSAPSMRQ
jgi:hypothetical protein